MEAKEQQIEIGKRACGCDSGYRVIGNDTSSRRPWMWYSPELEAAQLLARTICEQTGQEVEICKFVGATRLAATEFVKAQDA